MGTAQLLGTAAALVTLSGFGDPPGAGHVHTHICLNLPPFGDTFALARLQWHTQFVLNMQRRFFYGYPPAVPVA